MVGGAEEVEARIGDGARWTGVVTSECNTDVKIELACSADGSKLGQLSIGSPEVGRGRIEEGGGVPLSASDSVGISLVLDGVDGPPSSLRW